MNAGKLLKLPLYLLLGFMILALTGCPSSPPSPDNTAGNGSVSGKVTLSGTVATGVPIANATITIKGADGGTLTATTDATGQYPATDVSSLTAPYLLKVTTAAGADLYSVGNASGTVNIHPFTDLIIRNWYKVQNSSVDVAFTTVGATPTPPSVNDIATIEGVVRQILTTYMNGADVSPSNFNLITTPFNANHSGFDLVLDNLKVTQPTTPTGSVTIDVTGGGTTSTIFTVPVATDLTTITLPPPPMSDTVAPTTPGVIAATRTSATQVVLSWGAASDTQLAGYKIYQNGTQVGITDQPYYIDGAAPATSACYTVSAFDAAGNKSAQNTQVCASDIAGTADVTAPTAPGTLTATVISSSQIDLAWSASTDNVAVAGYRVMVGGSAIATLPATATSYSHAGLNGSTLYSYTVVAIDTSGNAASSAVASATTSAKTDMTAPSAPSGLTATAASDTQISLAWTASTDAIGVAGYKVYLSGILIGSSSTTSFSAVNLIAGTQYCYTVKAYDAAGNISAASAQACATTPTGSGPAPAGSSIVGGWYFDCTGIVAGSNWCTFTFLATGEYVMTQDNVNNGAGVQPGGMERGTYSWDSATGAFRSLCPRVDTNGEAGMSHPVPGICSGTTATVTVSSNTLNLGGAGGVNMTRLADANNPAVGSWITTSASTAAGPYSTGVVEVMVMLPNGDYVLASSGPLSSGGTDGIERGTFTWNSSTGAFSSTCPTIDTNGSRGLSNVGATGVCGVPASMGATMFGSGNQSTMTIPMVIAGVTTPVTIVSTRVTEQASTVAPQTFTEYALPAGSFSFGIVSGPDGNLWYTTDNVTNSIGKMTPAGVVTQYAIPSIGSNGQVGSGPQTIINGPDGNLWFVEGDGNKIAKITTAGVITEYPNTSGGWPQDLAVGPDGNIWFTDQGMLGGGVPSFAANGAIGKLDIATGVITKYPLLTTNTQADWITLGPDGAMWFTQSFGSNTVARIDMTGAITVVGNTASAGITTGPDGNLWLTMPATGAPFVASMTTAGTLTPYYIPTTTNSPFFIKAMPDGNLWIGAFGGSFAAGFTSAGALGRVTTSGVVTEYTLPASTNSNPGLFTIGVITVGFDGALWFTEPQSGKIGRYHP